MSDGGVNVIVQKQEGKSPMNDLELQMMLVDGRWGDKNINQELRERLKNTQFVKMKKGSILIDSQGDQRVLEEDEVVPMSVFLWDELSFFTRDFRLGNLDKADKPIVEEYAVLGADCLHLKMNRAFTVCMIRVAAGLELSQSKDGFFRKLLGTKQSFEERKEILETPSLLMPKKNR